MMNLTNVDQAFRRATDGRQIPGVVAMELLIGCQESEEVDHLQKFLRTFSLVWPDAAGFAQAWAD